MFVMNSIILAGIIHAVLLLCSKSIKGLTSNLGGGGGYQQKIAHGMFESLCGKFVLFSHLIDVTWFMQMLSVLYCTS